MFTNISWADYLIVIGLLLATYYIIVGLKFYSSELAHLLTSSRKLVSNSIAQQPLLDSINKLSASESSNMELQEVSSENLPAAPTNNSFEEIEQHTSQVQEALVQAASELFSQEAFIQLLRQILQRHPSLNHSPFKLTIQELIISECEKMGTIQLMKEELDELWREVYR